MNDTLTMDLFGLVPKQRTRRRRVEFVSPAEAKDRKTRGTGRALENCDQEWRGRALGWIERLAEGTRYTSDDLTESVGMPPGHPSAVGAVVLSASRMGLARRDGYVHGTRAKCNGAVVAVWVRTRRGAK